MTHEPDKPSLETENAALRRDLAQANKALVFHAASARASSAEVAALKVRLKELARDRAAGIAFGNERTGLLAEIESLRAKLEEAESACQRGRDLAADLCSKYVRLQLEKLDLTIYGQRFQASTVIRRLTCERDAARAEIQRLTDERDQARSAAADNGHQHARLLKEHGAARARVAELEEVLERIAKVVDGNMLDPHRLGLAVEVMSAMLAAERDDARAEAAALRAELEQAKMRESAAAAPSLPADADARAGAVEVRSAAGVAVPLATLADLEALRAYVAAHAHLPTAPAPAPAPTKET